MSSIFGFIITLIVGAFLGFTGCNRASEPYSDPYVASVDASGNYEGQLELEGVAQNVTIDVVAIDAYGSYDGQLINSDAETTTTLYCYTYDTLLDCSYDSEDDSYIVFSGEVTDSAWSGTRYFYPADGSATVETTFELLRLEQ